MDSSMQKFSSIFNSLYLFSKEFTIGRAFHNLSSLICSALVTTMCKLFLRASNLLRATNLGLCNDSLSSIHQVFRFFIFVCFLMQGFSLSLQWDIIFHIRLFHFQILHLFHFPVLCYLHLVYCLQHPSQAELLHRQLSLSQFLYNIVFYIHILTTTLFFRSMLFY